MAGALSSLALEEILTARGLVAPRDLEALPADPSGRRSLGDRLVAAGLLSEEQIAFAISEDLGYPLVAVTAAGLDPDLVRRVAADVLRDHRALPLLDEGEGEVVDVAFADPTDSRAVDAVSRALNRRVRPAVATAASIRAAIQEVYRDDRTDETPSGAVSGSADDVSGAIRLYAHLLAAVDQGAHQLLVVPGSKGGAVRLRREGIVEDRERLRPGESASLVARLKSLVGIGLRDAAAPRTATLSTRVSGRDVRLSLAFSPTESGEAAVVTLEYADVTRAARDEDLPIEVERAVADFLRRGTGLLVVNHARRDAGLSLFARCLARSAEVEGAGPSEVPGETTVTVSADAAIVPDGAVALRAAAFPGGFAEAAATGLALSPDVLALAPATGDLPPREAVLLARDGRRVAVLCAWRDAAETIVALRRLALPAGCGEAALRHVLTVATARRADGEGRVTLVEHVRLTAEDRARIEQACTTRQVRAALAAGGHRTLEASAREREATGEVPPGTSEEWA